MRKVKWVKRGEERRGEKCFSEEGRKGRGARECLSKERRKWGLDREQADYDLLCVAMCRYVVLVSGLNLGSSWCDQLSVEMLVDYITGQLGGPAVRIKQNIIVCHL